MCQDFFSFFSEHLVTIQHIVEHYQKEWHIQCYFNDTFSAVWETSYSYYNILSVLKVTGFPGSDCDGNIYCIFIHKCAEPG